MIRSMPRDRVKASSGSSGVTKAARREFRSSPFAASESPAGLVKAIHRPLPAVGPGCERVHALDRRRELLPQLADDVGRLREEPAPAHQATNCQSP